MANEPYFEVVTTAPAAPDDRILFGMADPWMAGLTAADYLVSNLEAEEVGYIASRNLPDITPFSLGQPRHPIRVYHSSEYALHVIISEIFLPVWVADPFANAVAKWMDDTTTAELTIAHGAPFRHSEEEHLVFHVATDDYRNRHFEEDDGSNSLDTGEGEIPPLAGGFFDGVVAELLVRALESTLPPTGVLTTPTHPPGPDLSAALTLLEGIQSVYGIDIDESELRERSEEMRRYYEELMGRMQALQEQESGRSGRDYPEDRMYM